MKRIRSLVSFIFLCLSLNACKKSKSEAPPPAPIAAYKLDNKSAKNSISSKLHGKLVGDPVNDPDSFGVANASLLLNGDDYVEVAASDLLDFAGNQYTLSAWIKPTSAVLKTTIVFKISAPMPTPYTLSLWSGVVRASVYTNTKELFEVEGTTAIKKNEWQHIAVTFTGEQLTVYYNGKPEGSVAIDRPLLIATGGIIIGHNTSASQGGFSGYLDNVRIYDKALTAGQVNSLYKNYNQ